MCRAEILVFPGKDLREYTQMGNRKVNCRLGSSDLEYSIHGQGRSDSSPREMGLLQDFHGHEIVSGFFGAGKHFTPTYN
jgi:hypothetical protein